MLFKRKRGEPSDMAHVRKRRALASMANGIILHTDYSGKQCPENTYRILARALRAEGFAWLDSSEASF